MKRILSKSLLIAVILLVLLSAGCAKSAIPDTIAEVEKALFSFQQYEITYDELKERVGGYYIDFDHTVGAEEFAAHEGTTYLYKDMAGMSLDESEALVAPIYENMAEMGLALNTVSSQVSVSKPVDAILDRQLVYTWREDVVEGILGEPARKIISTRYFLKKENGKWKIDWLDSGGTFLHGDEEENEKIIGIYTFPGQDEVEYVETITLK